jgi:carboxyl-terminal processing protease
MSGAPGLRCQGFSAGVGQGFALPRASISATWRMRRSWQAKGLPYRGAVPTRYDGGMRVIRPCVARLSVALAAALCVLAGSLHARTQTPRSHADVLLDEVWGTVNAHFFDPDFNDVDWPAARERCVERLKGVTGLRERAREINAMLAELRTSHTHLYTADEREYYELLDIFTAALAEDLKRVFADGVVRYIGIGIAVTEIDGRFFIADVLEGSPAQSSGLVTGDEIVSAGGRPFHPLHSFKEAAGEIVTLQVRRTRDQAQPMDVAVAPQLIVPHEMFLESVRHSARVIERDGRRLAYVRIRSYASETYHELLIELLSTEPLRSCDGLILDIRGGWGGANPEYLNIFNRDVPPLELIGRDGKTTTIHRQWRKPVVLLVDGGTRSGKEVLAHAFKTRGIGKIVGTRTAGAVMGGKPFLLSDGSLLIVAVSDVRVDGVRLEGVGGGPDVVVERGDIRAQGATDPQLDRAVDVLSEELKR